jgi:hypothetical protein
VKIRVSTFQSVPSEIRQVDGKWVIFDKLYLLDRDGLMHEIPAGETKAFPVELPERQERKRKRRK